MSWVKWTVAAIALPVVLLVALNALGHLRWRGLTEELNRRLDAGRLAPTPARYDARELRGLPPPLSYVFAQ